MGQTEEKRYNRRGGCKDNTIPVREEISSEIKSVDEQESHPAKHSPIDQSSPVIV